MSDNSQPQTTEVKQFFLASTEVVFEQQGVRRIERYNVVYPSKTGLMTAADLGLVQQRAQQRLFQTHPGLAGNVHVTDVFFIGVSQLGWMTDEQFNNLSMLDPQDPPEGTKKEEEPTKVVGNDNVVDLADPYR